MRKFAALVVLIALVLALSATQASGKTKRPSSSCKAALKAADSGFTTVAQVFGRTGRFFTEVSGDASNNSDDALAFVNALTATLQSYNADISPMQTSVTSEVQAYSTLRNACLAGH
jgi:hypothetical protein